MLIISSITLSLSVIVSDSVDFYDEITCYCLLHECMRIITVFSDIDDDWLDDLLSRVFLMDTYPILACVWCACLFSLCMAFLMWLRKGVVVTC